MGKKETEEAIQEASAGNLARFSTVDELMADLHADDEELEVGREVLTPYDPAEDLESEAAIIR